MANHLRTLILTTLLTVSAFSFFLHKEHKVTGASVDSLLKLKDIHRSIDGSQNNLNHP
jgi:hypothetical protein